MSENKIPDRTRVGLELYAKYGILPGGFLRAVLSNDLLDAACRADPENYTALREIVRYAYNKLPGEAFGSREKMLAWSEKMQVERLAEDTQEQESAVSPPDQ
jgi:hypothetical protein